MKLMLKTWLYINIIFTSWLTIFCSHHQSIHQHCIDEFVVTFIFWMKSKPSSGDEPRRSASMVCWIDKKMNIMCVYKPASYSDNLQLVTESKFNCKVGSVAVKRFFTSVYNISRHFALSSSGIFCLLAIKSQTYNT